LRFAISAVCRFADALTASTSSASARWCSRHHPRG
jgi:hypothetical protein